MLENLEIVEVGLEVSLALKNDNVLLTQLLEDLGWTLKCIKNLDAYLDVSIMVERELHFLDFAFSDHSCVDGAEVIVREYDE